MPGKSKDSKANKGKKALENEWELAVQAADNGERWECEFNQSWSLYWDDDWLTTDNYIMVYL